MKFSFHDSIETIIATGATGVGVEVTDRESLDALVPGSNTGVLAVNIDGQHGTGSLSRWTGLAAVQIAASEPPQTLLPSAWGLEFGFYSTRPDLDSIGAMAILVLRSLGWVFPRDADERGLAIDSNHVWLASEEAMARIAQIAAADSFRPVARWEPSPLPTAEDPWGSRPGPVDGTRDLAHVASLCSPRGSNVVLPLAERVAVVACWLLWGEDIETGYSPDQDREVGRVAMACGASLDGEDVGLRLRAVRVQVERARLDLVRAIEEAPPQIEFPMCSCGSYIVQPCCDEDGDYDGCGECGSRLPRLAIVRISQAGALGVGYCLAPAVVAFDVAVPGKVTIAGWAGPDGQTPYVDIPSLGNALNALEPCEWYVDVSACVRDGIEVSAQTYGPYADGALLPAVEGGVRRSVARTWGGPPALRGSPKGGTKLGEEVILPAARAALKRSEERARAEALNVRGPASSETITPVTDRWYVDYPADGARGPWTAGPFEGPDSLAEARAFAMEHPGGTLRRA